MGVTSVFITTTAKPDGRVASCGSVTPAHYIQQGLTLAVHRQLGRVKQGRWAPFLSVTSTLFRANFYIKWLVDPERLLLNKLSFLHCKRAH
ncbi:hypothetical protein RRG08_030478 [Elysia crispata]|uniref:Uncharacterized protein n=1 Tax=Elysia crispata TaxID=231223 RepID=A0AAE1B0C7_9GAST|nr:hypothetical protein RRG08_030478 [Elysia crispata]